jgi:pyruvate decarboxylase
MKATYNDVQEFRYTDLPLAFGASEGQAKGYVVKTKQEFDELLADGEFSDQKSKVLRVVEVHMPWDDAPELLKFTSKAAAKGIE